MASAPLYCRSITGRLHAIQSRAALPPLNQEFGLKQAIPWALCVLCAYAASSIRWTAPLVRDPKEAPLGYTCGIRTDNSSSCCCRAELLSIDVQTCAHHLHLSVMHAFHIHLASRHRCVYAHIHTRARIQSCLPSQTHAHMCMRTHMHSLTR